MNCLLLRETTPLGNSQTTSNSNLRFLQLETFPFSLVVPILGPESHTHPIPILTAPTLQGPALNYLDRAVQWAEECDLEAWV